MLKYREFLDLTEAEIAFILQEIFSPEKIENIKKNTNYNEITAEITTLWQDNEGSFEICDEVVLTLPSSSDSGIAVKFSVDEDDILKYHQFLLAKGCDYRLRNNPYLSDK